MKLTHSVIQTKSLQAVNESELLITVDYDPRTRSVEGVVSVKSHNWFKNVTTDLTHIFGEVFDEALNSMVDQINWDEEFLAHIDANGEPAEKEEAA